MERSSFRTPAGVPISSVTADEMRAVDRIAVEEFGLALLQMMENAGRALARHVRSIGGEPVHVIAGNGGNGGGGLAGARHLANRDVEVAVVLDRDPKALTSETARQYRILDEMGVPIAAGTDALAADDNAGVLVDALIGYGLSGRVRDPTRSLVETVNQRDAPVVSLDVPSGIDATTGETLGTAVDPDRTLTLALPKTGLSERNEPLVLADIGIPHAVYRRLDLEYQNPFEADGSVELVT